MNENEQRIGNGIRLDELASKIEEDPSGWVLVLGDEISFNKEEDRKKRLSRLARKAVIPEKGTYQEIYKAIQAQDYIKLSSALFGDIWDGATFLDKDQEQKLERRRAYAQRLGTRDTVNLCGTVAEGLQELLEKFSGIIVTTCQDETVEAAWEYGNSLPADNIVCTPYELTTSHEWSRWLDAGEGTDSRQDWPFDGTVLVKLFGSVSKPNRMLLSQEDIQSYYPASSDQNGNAKSVFSKDVNTVRLLEKLFREKNLLFLGVKFEGTGLLASANGILELLKGKGPKKENDPKRYALLTEGLNDYGIEPIDTEHTLNEVIRFLAKRSFKRSNVPLRQATKSEDKDLTWKKVQSLFFQYYIRRSPTDFLQRSFGELGGGFWEGRELEILRNDILGFQEGEKAPGTAWTREAVIQLALAANNLADFYDLAYVFKQEQEKEEVSGGKDLNQIPLRLLKSRLTQRSLRLHEILYTYESGFPLSFLRLLPFDGAEISGIPEKDLALCTKEGQNEWIKAGIQLVNSGIYIKHNERNNLYGRMIYADALMRFAGSHPYKERFQREIEQLRYQARDSYFYPLNPEHIQFDTKSFKSETKQSVFEAMLGNLYVILRDKVGGYQQIHATLQTETPKILSIMWKVEDHDLRWQPGLLYFLLYESRVVPEPEKTLKMCGHLMKQLEQKLNAAEENLEEWKRLFSMKLMVTHAKILIQSQSWELAEQEKAQKLCEEMCGEVEAAHRARKIWKGEFPEPVFEMYVRSCFLKGKVYGRKSTIEEIQRCKKGQKECHRQKTLLYRMHASFKKAADLIAEWERANPERHCWELRGELYRLLGEYHFKMSQYYMENRRYGAPTCSEESSECMEERSYSAAETKYREALNIYQKDSDRYTIPLADTLRSLADVYCRWAENCMSIPSERGSCDRKVEQEYLWQKCYRTLIQAYTLYRGNSDLHGIADVLQSMGHAESSWEADVRFRSRLNFYKTSRDIYTELRDDWSRYVADTFLQGAIRYLNQRSGRSIVKG